MASTTGTSAAALLFSFSAVALFFLLQTPPPGLTAEILASALDRFLDGRGLLELATRRNMILLCHAILLVILRDAGVLGTPASASRRSRSPPAVATAAEVVPQTAAPARPLDTRAAVVWRRRPRNRAAAPMNDAAAAAARRLVECQPQPAATWAAPLLTTGPPPAQAEEAPAVATKQIVLVESPRNEDDDDRLHRHDRAAVVEPLEHPTAIAADGERDDCDDRRIVTVADDDDKRFDDQTPGMEMEMELADDRTFEEFIESQRRQMRQESLRLVSSGYQ